MKADKLRLLVLTPEKRLLLKENLTQVRAKLIDGEIGIRAHHAPLLGETVSGPVFFGDEDYEDMINIQAGILKIDQKGATIFTSGFLERENGPKITTDESIQFERLTEDLLQQVIDK